MTLLLLWTQYGQCSTKATAAALARALLAIGLQCSWSAEKNLLFMTDKFGRGNPLVKAAYKGRLQRAQQQLDSAEEQYVKAGGPGSIQACQGRRKIRN
jgi:hypothetical protein